LDFLQNQNARRDPGIYRGGDFVSDVGWTSDKNKNARTENGAGASENVKKKKPGTTAVS